MANSPSERGHKAQSSSPDLVIRGATLYDGSGNPGHASDVAVRNGRIAEIGQVASRGRAEVDAAGLALMPGIIDVHTHYDAQITWDPTLSPSLELGVTTAIMGNCGFGIAPCPAHLRETMMKNLSVVEGMDLDALRAGIRWDFESITEYLDLVRRQRPYLNVALFAGHSTIRTAVMGEEASARQVPTPAELGRMKRMVREALDAGAIGFASSFSPNHSGYGGQPMPSTIATEEELRTLVAPLGEAGKGVFMMATGPRATPDFIESLAADTGRPMFISTVLTMYNKAVPELGRSYYERCAAAIARGHEVYIQTSCQPLTFDFTLKDPYLFLSHDAFERIQGARPEEFAAVYRDPAFRKRFRENLAQPKQGVLFYGDWSKVETGKRSITQIAAERGVDPLDCFFDLALAENLETPFQAQLFQNDDAGVAPLLKHHAGVIALSDAGAHLTFLCDAGFGLHFLSHWARETGTFTWEEAVHRLTGHPAEKYRIPERGRIAPGNWADLLLFDPKTVGISGLERVPDLPGGGMRVVRRPLGVHGLWVNGERVFDGKRIVEREAGPGQVLTQFN
jgi:N-acyl-D-amino-acid deacylase